MIIEKNIPLPGFEGVKLSLMAVIQKMEVGDSVLVPDGDVSEVSSIAHDCASVHGVKLTALSVDGGVRIWRLMDAQKVGRTYEQVREKIMDYVSEFHGISEALIQNKMRKSSSKDVISSAIKALIDEGLIRAEVSVHSANKTRTVKYFPNDK